MGGDCGLIEIDFFKEYHTNPKATHSARNQSFGISVVKSKWLRATVHNKARIQ